MNNNDLNLDCLDLIKKISDITRIVDPLRKEVIEYKKNEADLKELHCFDFWGKNKVCDNCISMRAYHDNITYVKIEYKKDNTYMITAVPHQIGDRRIVLEIIKDITKSILLDSSEDTVKEQSGIHALIDNMNKLAFSDPLTNLYNRRYLLEKLPVDLLNSALLSTELAIIMGDIDHFKKVNDDFGHVAGDQTLKNVAGILKDCIKRDSDWVARFGGEEFVICMPGANLEIAKKAAELMRKRIEMSSVQYDDHDIRVTISFGIYCLKPTGNEEPDDILKNVDEKLYLAKKNGRNRTEY